MAQLATPVGFIGYLIWDGIGKSKVIREKEVETREWQNKAFNTMRDSQKELYEATQAFERIVATIRGI